MKRRAFFVSAVVASATAAAPIARADGELQVFYIGGGDCPFCRSWKNKYQTAWRESPMYRQVKWIEVEAVMLRHAYRDQYWPADLKPVRDQLPEKSGVPRFLIVKDGKVVANELGANRWPAILAELKKRLG